MTSSPSAPPSQPPSSIKLELDPPIFPVKELTLTPTPSRLNATGDKNNNGGSSLHKGRNGVKDDVTTVSCSNGDNGSVAKSTSAVLKSELKPSSATYTDTKTVVKKRKRQSAFRIKTGCLVALRYRSEGNDVKDKNGNVLQVESSIPVVETWVDPTLGLSQGYLIMGRRIRCCFPKSVLSEGGPSTRIVEGDIVGLVDHERYAAKLKQAAKQRTAGYIPVELLIDGISMLPFLERVDDDVDISKLTENERKRHRYEDIIRGKNKVIVRVNLGITFGAKASSGPAETEDTPLVCKWVLRERVAASRTTGEDEGQKTKQKLLQKQYVGNKYDSDTQQEQNWRWLATRKGSDDVASNLVGEVISVLPTSGESIATVMLKRVSLPETTKRGRLVDQSPLEFYEMQAKEEVQVRVEQLVILSRKVARDTNNGEGFASTARVYSDERKSWRKHSNGISPKEGADFLVCHRCGVEGSEMLKDHIAVTPAAISCPDCLNLSKNFGKSGTFLKSCRCQQCIIHHSIALCGAFERSTESRDQNNNASATKKHQCTVCCLRCKTGLSCKDCDMIIHKRCAKWARYIESGNGDQVDERCRSCRPVAKDLNNTDVFMSACTRLQSTHFSDFDLPKSYFTLHLTQTSADKLITVIKPRGSTPRKTSRTPQKKRARSPAASKHLSSQDRSSKKLRVEDDHSSKRKFKLSCSRLLPYDPIKRRFEGIAKHHTDAACPSRDVARNLRSIGSQKKEEKKTAIRAARANQRRMMKDVAAFGSTFLELDALAGRESHLRFDRSGIHAWGVFADQEIREGEVIVEYRGEIIGNAMAEKREKEYEQAKIGSDYMFRIDANYVCDGTKRGNVARYINASCGPNCYTQIISINNTKRIVVYAKKDIQVGQELCYDYKFPVEFNEEKRIPCHCATKECRGFMNWDKRYVAIPIPPHPNPNLRRPSSSSLKSAAVEEASPPGAAHAPLANT